MSTYGYDLELLCGAEQNFASTIGLQFDGVGRSALHDMPSNTEVEGYQISRGLVPSDMFATMQGPDFRLIEFDCVMVQRPPSAT